MKKQISNQQAYETLTKNCIHWDRKDDKHIIVWTSGYKTNQAYEIERYLLTAAMVAVDQQFDNISGKTFTIYKHKAA